MDWTGLAYEDEKEVDQVLIDCRRGLKNSQTLESRDPGAVEVCFVVDSNLESKYGLPKNLHSRNTNLPPSAHSP